MNSAPLIRSRPSGVSLLEVLVMAVILGICALALGQAMMGAMHQTRTADELRAASFAARKNLELALADPDMIVKYGSASGADKTFAVTLNDALPTITLTTPNGENAGEIIVMDKQTLDAATVGRDLDGDGTGDGVTMAPWPIDLGTAGGTLKPKRVVVGAVVRWASYNGSEMRYELWSVR